MPPVAANACSTSQRISVSTARPGAEWSTFATTVTGGAGTDRLTLREVGSQSGDGHGALLDDFRLVPTGSVPVAPGGGAGQDRITLRVSGDAWKGDPAFALSVNGKTVAASTTVTADRAEGEERADWWEHAVATWPTYASYQEKTDRVIPVVVLEPR